MMKKIFLVILLTLPAAAGAYDRGELAEFNDLYRNGQYEEALEGYKLMIAKEPSNQWAWYNAGNALFRLNRPGPAVYDYTRAFLLDPRSQDIRANLDFALRQTGQSLVPEGAPAALHYVYYIASEAELKAAAILLFWLACLAGAAAFLLDGGQKRSQPPFYNTLHQQTLVSCKKEAGSFFGRVSLAAAGLLVFTALWFAGRQSSPFSSAGVVTKAGGTRMLSGPGEKFKTYASAPEGRLVRILDTGDEAYYEIGLQKEGIKGWALKNEIERL